MITEWMSYDCHRRDFYESWIVESPQRIYARNDFITLLDNLTAFMEVYQSQLISSNLYFLEGKDLCYVYYKTNDNITAIVELKKTPLNLTVVNVAKESTYQNFLPYMSDIYKEILTIANNKSLRFTSDDMITDKGLNIWKKLMNDGYTVSVYEPTSPGRTLTKISTVDDLEKYLGDNTYKKYRFVLSENYENWFGYVVERFMTRRVMELSYPPHDFNLINGL